MALSGGSVYVKLGALFDNDGFNRFDRAVGAARRERDIVTELRGDYDAKGFGSYERSIREAKGHKDVVTELKADYDRRGFEQYDRATDKASRSAITAGASSKTGSAGLLGLASSAKVAAGALGGAGLYYALKSVVGAASEAQDAHAQTEARLKSTGGQANVTAGQVEGLATKLSRLSGVDDEVVQSAENLMLTFTQVQNRAGEGNNVFSHSIRTAQDLSKAYDQDLRSSVIQLGKALQDPAFGASALSRIGAVTHDQAEQIQKMAEQGVPLVELQKKLLASVDLQVQGSAKAYGRTLPGALDKAKVALDNVAETVGQKLSPFLVKAANGVTNFLNVLSGSGRASATTRAIMDKLSEGFRVVRSTMEDLWAIAGPRLKDAFESVSATFRSMAPDLENIARKVGDFLEAMAPLAKGAFRKAIDGMASALKGFAKVVKGVVQVISGILSGDFKKVWAGVKNIFSGGVKAVLGTLKELTALPAEVLGRFGKLLLRGFRAAFRFGLTAVKEGVGFLVTHIGLLPALVSGKLFKIPGLLASLWTKAFKFAVGAAGDGISALVGLLAKLPGKAYNAVKGVPGKILGVIKKIPGLLKDAISGAGAIVSDIGHALGDWLNDNTIFGDHVHIGVPIGPDIDFDLPAFKRGGWIGGAGTEDSEVIRAAPGEFVVNARDAGRHAGLLETINRGGPAAMGAAGGSMAEGIGRGADQAERRTSGLVKKVTESFASLRRGATREASELEKKVKGSFQTMGKEGLEHVEDLEDDTGDHFRRMRVDGGKDLDALERSTTQTFSRIAKTGDRGSSRFKSQVGSNFSAAAKAADRTTEGMARTTERRLEGMATSARVQGAKLVRYFSGSMRSSDSAVDRGLSFISKAVSKALSSFGASPSDFSVEQDSPKKAAGGWIGRPGEAGPDDELVWVGRGEAVVNRHQQGVINAALGAMFGTDLTGVINSVRRPHYAASGIVIGDSGRKADQASPTRYDAIVREADRIDKLGLSYVWGGSHGSSPTPPNGPFDCSSAVSHLLQAAGYSVPTVVSGELAGMFEPGKGKVSILANPEHTYMVIGGRAWGTSEENPGGGPGWIDGYVFRPGFSIRHPGDLSGPAGGSVPTLPNLELFGPPGDLRRIMAGAAKGKKPAGALQQAWSAGQAAVAKAFMAAGGGGQGLREGLYEGPLDRTFPWDSAVQIAPWKSAMLAERAGLPGVTFAQIAHGESNWEPGAVGYDPGGTIGLGLWQITTHYNDDLIESMGGRGQMLNPWKNAQAARAIYDSQGIGAWYGTQFMTDSNKHWLGNKDINAAQGKAPEMDVGQAINLNPDLGPMPDLTWAQWRRRSQINLMDPEDRREYWRNRRIKADFPGQDAIEKLLNETAPGTVGDAEKAIAGAESDYAYWDRRFGLTDETFVKEDPRTGKPIWNKPAVQRRRHELRRLIGFRETMLHSRDKELRTGRRVQGRLSNYLQRLSGLHPKLPERRKRLRALIKDYRHRLKTWGNRIQGWRDDRRNRALDLTELHREMKTLGVEGSEYKSFQHDLADWRSGQGEDGGEPGDGTATPAEIARAAALQLASFNNQRASLFSSFGSNYIPTGAQDPFGSAAARAAGARYYGAFGAGADMEDQVLSMLPGLVPAASGDGSSTPAPLIRRGGQSHLTPIRGGGNAISGVHSHGLPDAYPKVQLIQHYTEPPPDPHAWSRAAVWDIEALA